MVTIYGLEDATTGAAYIGCTAGRIGKRMREHRCLLKAGKHTSIKLQIAWNDHADKFQMKPLEVMPDGVSVIVKRERELFWMKQYRDMGLLLNENEISYSPPQGAQSKAAAARVANGYRPSAESNLKRRLAQLGKPKGHGAKISATKKRKTSDEIVSSASKDKMQALDKEPKHEGKDEQQRAAAAAQGTREH